MPALLITCPQTRQPVPTGLEYDTLAFIWSVQRARSLACPACHRTHRWEKEDAYLQGHPPKSPPGGLRNVAWPWRPADSALPATRRLRRWLPAVALAIIAAAWFATDGPGGGWLAMIRLP